MALIDKGKDILPNINIQIRFPWLKIGLIVLSMGLAFCADFLAKIFLPSGFMRGSNEELFVLCSVLIFGGIAIILGHIIDRPRTRNNG
jgi:hypothetical protein